jgi:hypothetical protein
VQDLKSKAGPGWDAVWGPRSTKNGGMPQLPGGCARAPAGVVDSAHDTSHNIVFLSACTPHQYASLHAQ